MIPIDCVVIEVSGGTVTSVLSSKSVNYVIVDWDNIDMGDDSISIDSTDPKEDADELRELEKDLAAKNVKIE